MGWQVMAYTIESLPSGGMKPRYTIESLPEEPNALDKFQGFTQGFADFTNKAAIPMVTAGMGGPLVQAFGLPVKAAMGAAEGYIGEKLNQLLGVTQESPVQTGMATGMGAAGTLVPKVAQAGLEGAKWALKKLPGSAEVLAEGTANRVGQYLNTLVPGKTKEALMGEVAPTTPISLEEYTPQSVAMNREVGGQLPTTVQRSQALTQESEQLLTSLTPKTSSDELYALANQFNPKLPTGQYKKVAQEILEEQDKGALLTPGLASGKLRELASNILVNQEATPARQIASSLIDPATKQAFMRTVPGKPAPVASFQEARASLKILRNAAKDMTTPEQAGYVHLRSTLLKDMEEAAEQGAAGPARDALRAANATARKEFALEDVADMLQGKSSQKLVGGKLEIGGVSPLKNLTDKIRTDELFKKSFQPHELQALEQYVMKVAGADKAPLSAPYEAVSGSMKALDRAMGETGDPVRLAQLKQYRAALERDVARTGKEGAAGAPGLINRAEIAGKREGAIGEVRGMVERGMHTKKGFDKPLLQGEAPLKAWTTKLFDDPTFVKNFNTDEQTKIVGYLTEVAKNPSFGMGGEANYLGRAVGGVVGGGIGQLVGLGPAGTSAGMVLGMGLPEAVAVIMRSSVGRQMLGAAAKSGQKPSPGTIRRILQLVRASAHGIPQGLRASTTSAPEEE